MRVPQKRIIGVDLGAASVKAVVLDQNPAEPWGDGEVAVAERHNIAHHKDPRRAVSALLDSIGLFEVNGIAATGRLGRMLDAHFVPTKAALRAGLSFVHPELEEATVLSIGAHGFCVLEVHGGGEDWFQQNSRCSQGTGNFLAQLVQRFGLSVEQASELCDQEPHPAPLSGRCPVILKTDMTHLANKGETQSRILAGLYDAVCENVVTLLRPRLSPRDVVLVGGVANAPRIRRTIAAWLAERGMRLCEARAGDAYLEAIGAGVLGLSCVEADAPGHPMRSVDQLFVPAGHSSLERVPSLRGSLSQVHRMPKTELPAWTEKQSVLFGLDIGSTGSKAVAIEAGSGKALWEAYGNTEGAPVQAAQRLVKRWQETHAEDGAIVAFGVTGSGREVVGSLLRTCYGAGRVFVMNEIAAHARGATELDPSVDTIFEIGGQDAKYIRLEGGRVVDAAMNEACSAGTGSFIAEQGTKFDGVGTNVVRLGQIALEADSGVSLGQHCSVFMAEIIDEAIGQGAPQSAIIAGLYDSVIQNYLNRVKGARSIGRRIFCQGMPFSSDALASAVARQTGREVVVPPSPGTIGAFGIALLVKDELPADERDPLDARLFLRAHVSAKETIVCRSTKGCGGSGNHCRIDRLTTLVDGKEQRFLWGGNCSLYDRGIGRGKLPDLAPDPFRQREALLDEIFAAGAEKATGPVVALADEFALKSLAPLFVSFLQNLGFRCHIVRHLGAATLRKGIEGARVPFCAPMQMLHGAAFDLEASGADVVFFPMIKDLPRIGQERHGTLCPIVLGSPDLIAGVLPASSQRISRPVIEFGTDGYRGQRLVRSMRKWADELGVSGSIEAALADAIAKQIDFEQKCVEIGTSALEYCGKHGVVPVAVLGRPYTIYNDVLNSNVPNILRSLGAMPIPVDCVPVPSETPFFGRQFWAHTQRNLRAAQYVRRTPGLYSVFCSNYACGPDSFTLHFYSYIMQGKPFAVVETDGHSGDAGTKTRMEAFLYCVDSDRKTGASEKNPCTDFATLERSGISMTDTLRERPTMLLPRMGPDSEIAAATLRGEGYVAECLALSTREDVRTGRRYTSGKECVPMMLTLGTLLNRIERERHTSRNFSLFMPTASGPCRFGVYQSLYKIVLEQTGWSDRAKVVSPDDGDYFREMSASFVARVWLGFCGHDLLEAMRNDVRPVETEPGAADRIYDEEFRRLIALLERPCSGSMLSLATNLLGGMWGIRRLVKSAAERFAAVRSATRDAPTVSVVGEIFGRLDPFANDFIVDKLHQRGIRVRMAPFIEWLEYTSYLAEERLLTRRLEPDDNPISIALQGLIQRTTLGVLYGICQKALGWPARVSVEKTIEAARPYINPELTGEAVLTVGGPLHEYAHSLIDGVVIVGPHECMPCKIAEAQYGTAAEALRVPYLSIALNGDPVDTEVLDRFAFDIHQRYRACQTGVSASSSVHRGARSGFYARTTKEADLPKVGATADAS